MPLPLRRKRCSFGGKEGVWWRRKSPSTVVPTHTTPHADLVMTTTDADEEAIRLDKILARPVLRHRSSCQNHVSSSSSEESGDDNPSSLAFELERPKQSCRSTSTRLTKRRKTFGGQSRRPLSLLLSNENNLLSSPFLERDRETPVAQPTSPDPEVNLDPRPASQPTLRPLQPRDNDIMESMCGTAPNSVVSPFRFSNEDQKGLNQRDTPQRPTATSSIQQAREYFAHLDSVHQLQIDSSFSPSPCRPITRTTRKVHLSSPGFVDEYAKYTRASRELGVTPIATREYAKSRRQFFRKAELFDGFVDS